MIFIIIGTSRIGRGRIGIRGGSYNELFFYSNATIFDRIVLSMLSNASVVNIFDLILESNADVLDGNLRQVLSNATILGTLDLELLSNASIAALLSIGIESNACVVITQLISLLSNASCLGPMDIALLCNGSVSGPVAISMYSNASIADRIAKEILSNASISEYVYPEIITNAYVASLNAVTCNSNADVVDNRYWAIGTLGNIINLSGKVYDPRSRGFGIRTSQQRIIGSRRTDLLDEGLDGGEIEFFPLFITDSERATFQKTVNNDSTNLVLFRGRSDRYQRVARIAVEPDEDYLYAGSATLKITCFMEDPYLYHSVEQGIDLGANSLPMTGLTKYNYGTVESPLLFRIGGFYFSGQLASPYAKCVDSNGVEDSSLYIGPGLLSNEYAELTLDGAQKFFLIHTYQDSFSALDNWLRDAIQSNCISSIGQISVSNGAWFYYKFQGYPTKENIKLIATITKSGSPIIQYSTDGTTWITAIATSEIVSGVQTTYNLTGTEKLSTVYVRFYAPIGSSMSVYDVDFEILRDISSQYDQIPYIQPGEVRALKVTGSGSSKAKVKATFRARWHPT